MEILAANAKVTSVNTARQKLEVAQIVVWRAVTSSEEMHIFPPWPHTTYLGCVPRMHTIFSGTCRTPILFLKCLYLAMFKHKYVMLLNQTTQGFIELKIY